MRVRLNGTRGSVGRAGPTTLRYGGDTSSVEIASDDGATLLLDAGSGIVHAESASRVDGRIDILLTHLHMDHIQGLGFFRPLFEPDVEVHMWGPISSTSPLSSRLARYLSPPLFPVRLRELPAVTVHDLSPGRMEIGPFSITADFVIHPGQTYGYRVETDSRSLAYLPDHEPALGGEHVPADPMWTSGHDLAAGVDLLIHDAQYTDDEYPERIGWGHSTLGHALGFAASAGVERLVTFHHEPDHTDREIDRHHEDMRRRNPDAVAFQPGLAGAELVV